MPLSDEFQYAQTVRGIVERIAYQMGDAEPGAEFEGLDEAWIRARVFDTFKWLQGRRPDLFATEETITLLPGERQVLPIQCDRLLEVYEIQIDGKAYPVHMAEYEDLRASQVYNKLQPECGYCHFHAALYPQSPERFLISPAITQPATIQATCSNMMKFFDDDDTELDCEVAKWINTVVEYVLFQAFSMDGNASVTEADAHRATFFDLAPVQRREPNGS